MQATRREIIDVLKRRSGGTVDELAKALGLSPMCIRQHLALLDRDGYVTPREVRRRTGRPHYFYTLTEKADSLFPKSYDRLASGILDELKENGGAEQVRALMRRLGDKLGAQYAEALADKPLRERMEAVVNLLGDGSPLGEWKEMEEGYTLTEYDCPYHRVSREHPEVCLMHARVLSRVLEADVQRLESRATGGKHCTYLLRKTATA